MEYLGELTVGVIIAALIAIIYSLRTLFILDKRIERIEQHIERIATRVMREELKIEKALKSKRRKRR